jgi:ERCC4-type nuclease
VSSPAKTFTVIVKVATSTRQCSARVVFCAAENLTKKKRDVGVKVVASVPTTGNCKKKKKGAEFMILPLELYLGFWV